MTFQYLGTSWVLYKKPGGCRARSTTSPSGAVSVCRTMSPVRTLNRECAMSGDRAVKDTVGLIDLRRG
jgi:hypothetical protein